MDKPGRFNIITMTITLMVVYNFFYLFGKYLPSVLPGLVQPVFLVIAKNGITLGLLEALGAISLFVDMVGAWDRRTGRQKQIHTAVVIALVLLFVFKLAMRMFDGLLPEFT